MTKLEKFKRLVELQEAVEAINKSLDSNSNKGPFMFEWREGGQKKVELSLETHAKWNLEKVKVAKKVLALLKQEIAIVEKTEEKVA